MPVMSYMPHEQLTSDSLWCLTCLMSSWLVIACDVLHATCCMCPLLFLSYIVAGNIIWPGEGVEFSWVHLYTVLWGTDAYARMSLKVQSRFTIMRGSGEFLLQKKKHTWCFYRGCCYSFVYKKPVRTVFIGVKATAPLVMTCYAAQCSHKVFVKVFLFFLLPHRFLVDDII